MFWDNYLKLCTEKKSSPNKVAAELGFSNATCTQWKKKGSTPGGANLKKLADYFGVSTDFLIANNEISQIDPDAEAPAPTRINENELSLEEKTIVNHMVKVLREVNEEQRQILTNVLLLPSDKLTHIMQGINLIRNA